MTVYINVLILDNNINDMSQIIWKYCIFEHPRGLRTKSVLSGQPFGFRKQ